jgi:hypothetical protein
MSAPPPQWRGEDRFEELYPPDSSKVWFHEYYRASVKRAFAKGYAQCAEDYNKAKRTRRQST